MDPEDDRMLKSLSIIGRLRVEAESDKQRLNRLADAGYVILLSGGQVAVYALTVRGRARLNALHAGKND
jgi:Mn-dependent DtxR family transcriptional regulator